MKSRLKIFAPVLLALAAVLGMNACSDSNSVSLEQAKQDSESGAAILIDVREPSEHAQGVAAQAKLLPLSQLEQRMSEIPTDKSKPVYLICNTQNRSSRAVSMLQKQAGYEHLRFVKGGMSGWMQNAWPVVKPAGQ